MRIFTFARAFRVRAYSMDETLRFRWLNKTKRTIFVDLFFFVCVQSKQCGNGKTNIIANLHRQWCSHSVSALSHQLPGTFLQTKYSSSNAPSVDRWFFSISIQPNVKWYSLPPVCLLLITIVMLLIFWTLLLLFTFTWKVLRFPRKFQIPGKSASCQPTSQPAHITMNFRSIYRQSEYMPSRAVWYNNNSNSNCSIRSICTQTEGIQWHFDFVGTFSIYRRIITEASKNVRQIIMQI